MLYRQTGLDHSMRTQSSAKMLVYLNLGAQGSSLTVLATYTDYLSSHRETACSAESDCVLFCLVEVSLANAKVCDCLACC